MSKFTWNPSTFDEAFMAAQRLPKKELKAYIKRHGPLPVPAPSNEPDATLYLAVDEWRAGELCIVYDGGKEYAEQPFPIENVRSPGPTNG